jgi:sigma-B regulation protein RsbU (phosphoserine phosphatase)
MNETPPGVHEHSIVVLLIDDQRIVGEALRRMLAAEADIVLHHETDPALALARAEALQPTVILQDLVMPGIDGLTLLRTFREHARTREVPMIVLSSKEEPKTKADAFALGASDYLVKLPDKVELVARIRHHSNAYIATLQRNEAYAASYAASKPSPPSSPGIAIRAFPAARAVGRRSPPRGVRQLHPLGGDGFGYFPIDAEPAMFLLDVCGHGVGAALLGHGDERALRAGAARSTFAIG